MPIYSYVCENEKCQHAFEVSKFMAESDTPENCPECGKVCVRDFERDIGGIYMKPPIKTLGSLRDQNTAKFSEDYKQHLSKTQDDKEFK